MTFRYTGQEVIMRAVVLLIVLATGVEAQRRVAKVETRHVSGGVHMMVGRGSNMGLLVGDQGALLVDGSVASIAKKVEEAIGKVTPRPVKLLINTHWHDDHTGGNVHFGARGAIIVSHGKAYERMTTKQFYRAFRHAVPPIGEEGRPAVTFDDTMTFHWNDEEVRLFRVKNAHTDGDIIVHFVKADVFHMGDAYESGVYPFIDVGTGGRITGTIAAMEKVLARCGPKTKIIPGHGKLATPADLRASKEMLEKVRDRVEKLREVGKTPQEIVDAKPTKDLDATWQKGFMKADLFVRIVCDGFDEEEKTKAARNGK